MPAPSLIAEFQGLYGPFTVTERVLQKIWLRSDFDLFDAHLVDGRSLEVIHPGTWNLLGGPDFTGAQIRVDGQLIEGDIEVHFRVSDWSAHGHGSNPAFGRVVLHVVLFPPDPAARAAVRGDGFTLPTLALLSRLHRDLEEYAADDALERLTARDDWRRLADLAAKPVDEVDRILRNHARSRWEAKVRYARIRVDRLGFEAAAHQTALEILGYRFNRAPMLAVATRYPLVAWCEPLDTPTVFASAARTWRLQGVRPANHPRVRLEQYARWVQARPRWPDRLVPLLGILANPDRSGAPGPRKFRADIPRCRSAFAEDVTGGVLDGPRLDTLICDGFLPLIAAQGQEHFDAWFDWYLGDVPAGVKNGLRRLGLIGRPGHPACHGMGQGLIGWFLANQ
ncbi:MAG TPA: DUF2851 family protein [Candidatus Didemnitutus sp.]|nr:DUF2851 family protein [Candidatus Didemnitutus sp.]